MSHKRKTIWAIGLFAAMSLVPLFGTGVHAGLTTPNDHLHHAHATKMFWTRGIEVYTKPFGELAKVVSYPYPDDNWAHMPMAYPPGIFVFFLPYSWLGAWVKLSHEQFAALGVLYMCLVAAWSSLMALRCLKPLNAIQRLGAILYSTSWICRLGMDGFFDVAWLGCGLAGISQVQRNRHDKALLWFSAAALLHYRAAVLIPVCLFSWLIWIKRNFGNNSMFDADPEEIAKRWIPVAMPVLAVVITGVSFVLMYPVTHAHRASHEPMSAFIYTTPFLVTSAAIVGHTLIMLIKKEFVVAAAFLIGGFNAMVDFNGYLGYWHHGTLLVPVMFMFSKKSWSMPWVTLLLATIIQSIVWKGTFYELPWIIHENFHPNWIQHVFQRWLY